MTMEALDVLNERVRFGRDIPVQVNQLLQQAVGQRMAKQMSFTCQFISAEKALAHGLVNEVVPHDQLLVRAREIASEICSVNQNLLPTIKSLIEYRNSHTMDESYSNERKGFKKFVEMHLHKK